MVIIIEARFLQAGRLIGRQHAQGHAAFKTQGLHVTNNIGKTLDIAVLQIAPGGAHAESACTGILGLLRRGADLFAVEQLFGLHARVIGAALGAVSTIFLATAGLDVQQGAQLDAIGIEVLLVHLVRARQKIQKRQLEQGLNLRTPRLLGARGWTSAEIYCLNAHFLPQRLNGRDCRNHFRDRCIGAIEFGITDAIWRQYI